MNKGFFVVFLGVIVGAMALIFVNQASNPTPAAPPARTVADAAPVSPPPPPPAAVEPTRRTAPAIPAEPPRPQNVEPVAPEQPKPETPKPEQVKPEQRQPESVRPEPVKPDAAKPSDSTAAQPQPAPPARETQPQTPATPVTSKPETPVSQEKPRKSLALLNIGLHFKNNGVALRIEADGPFSYKTFALPTPDRYVVDLVGKWRNMRAPKVPANMLIKSARVGSQSSGPRLVLDMQRSPRKHNVTWISPTVLEIQIE